MTQKELLYFEDAIEHEENIMKIIEEDILNLKDERLISFMKNELAIHKSHQENLLKLLGEKAHE